MIMLVSRIRLERILTDPQRRAYNVLGLKEEKNKLGLIVDGDTIWHFLPSILLFSFFSNPIEKKFNFPLKRVIASYNRIAGGWYYIRLHYITVADYLTIK